MSRAARNEMASAHNNRGFGSLANESPPERRGIEPLTRNHRHGTREIKRINEGLTLMDLEMGGAGDVLAGRAREPARVLAAVLRHAVLQLQREVVLLGHDLDAVRQLVLQGLVVPQPRGRQAGHVRVRRAAEQRALPS